MNAKKGQSLADPEDLKAMLDLVSEKYLFQQEEGSNPHYQGMFRTDIRKRKVTLFREMQEVWTHDMSCIEIAPMMGSWKQNVAYCTKNETATGGPIYMKNMPLDYAGDDVEFLKDEKRRYSWQNEILKMVLTEDQTGVADCPDDRSVIFIQDSKGSNGKSKLCKYLCYISNDVAKITFGTAGQLRSGIVAAGPRKLYIVDIPRTLGVEDSQQSLYSVIEDVKNGCLQSCYYGKYSSLLMNPPHVIIFSNAAYNPNLLSADRWQPYYILEKQLVPQKDAWEWWKDHQPGEDLPDVIITEDGKWQK